MSHCRNAIAAVNAFATALRRAAVEAALRPLLEGLETRSHFSVAPVAHAGGPYNVAEGQSVTISGLASTDSDGTIAAYQWDTNYSVARGFRQRLTGGTWTFTADDSGTRTIALRVVDNSGDVSSVQTATITISDVAPTITLVAPATVNEASPASVSWSYTDPGLSDAVTGWSMDWGDGTTGTFAGAATAATHTYDEDGSYTMTLTATQADGQTSVTHAIAVANVPPVVVATTPHDTFDEGEIAQVDFNSPNRGGTLDGWAIDWGDGHTDLLAANRSHATHTYTDSGSYTATIIAQEPDGGSGSNTVHYTVRNVAPTVALTGLPATEFEGHSITAGSTVSDPGQDDTETYGWTVYRNGSLFSLPGGTVTNGASFTFMPTDNGSYVVRLSVMDDEGAITTVNSAAISVANVAPTATITGTPNTAVDEGATVSLTANPSDGGAEDTFSYAWSVTKNGSAFALPNGLTTNAAAFSFVPTDNGTYVATCVVSDDDGGTVGVNTAAITVNNVAPTAAITGTPAGGVEGTAINVTADPHDAGSADTFTYAWTVTKDGSPYAVATPTTAGAFGFTPTDNGDYVIHLAVTDDDGAAASATSSTISITNAAPTAVVTGPTSGVEGSALNFTVAPSDAGSDDTFTYAWTVTKNGNAYALPGGTITNASAFGFTPADNAAYAVSVVVTDDDGGSVTRTANVTVANANPVAAITGAPASGTEGSPISVGSTVTDAGVNDTFSYAWSVSKGGNAYTLPGGVVTNASTFAFTPDDNGSYVITLAVTDNDNGVATISSSAVVVSNVNPTGGVTGEPVAPIGEGAQIDLTASGQDDGTADTLTYAWTITKDGQAWMPTAGTVLNDASLSFVPTDNGSYVATVAITDDDGGSASVSSQTILVTNSAPTAAITGAPASGTEGSGLALAAGVTDDGSADTFTYAWTVTKDGTPVDLTGITANAASFNFTPADNGTYVFGLAVTDDDGATTTTSSTLTVNNAAPVPTISGNASVNEDHAITLTAAAHDPGVLDTQTYLWSVTRNGNAYTLPGGTVTNASAFTFTPNLYGTYVASCVVTDNDGGSATATKTVTVNNVAPTAAITGVPNGPRAEGSPITLHGVATDAGGESNLTYAWAVTRNGQSFALPNGTVTNTTTLEFTPTDNGSYRATFAVTDSGNLTTTSTTSAMIVTNALPYATMTGTPNAPVSEGTAVTLHVDAADPGSEDTFAYAWTVTKNGSAFALPNNAVANAADFTFTPTDDGTYVATCVVTDDDGGPASVASGAISVTNVNPTVTIAREISSDPIKEGDIVQFVANPADAGAADTFTYQWTATKDGQPFALPNGSTGQHVNFRPTDQGAYALTVVVTDDDGGTVTAGTNFNATNANPVVTLDTADSVGVEGQNFVMQANATDPGVNDVLSYSWTVVKPDATQVVVPGTLFGGKGATFTPTDNGNYYVRLTVTDADGGTKLGSTHQVVVANANPLFTSVTVPTTGTEGSPVTASATATDVPADTVSYAWSVARTGNGPAFTLPGGTVTNASSFTFTPTNNGTYVVTVVATDEDGGTNTSYAYPVNVANAAPTAVAGGDTSGFEGTVAHVTATAADAGSEDAFTYAWTVTKDGVAYALPQGTAVNAATLAFLPTDQGSYVATCVVADPDGGAATVTRTVTIANVAPTAGITGTPSSPTTEGTAVDLSGTVTDPGAADTQTYAWTVTKDGQPFQTVAPSSSAAFSFTPTDNGSYVVTLVVNDGLATDTVSTAAIVVNNAPPAGTISGPTTGNEGSALTLTAAVTDPGSADMLAYAWTMTKNGVPAALPNGIVTDAAMLVYTPADQGTYAFTCVVSDDDGGTVTLTHSVAVANVNPLVTQTGVPATGVEGTALTVGSTATDPGDDTLSYGWTVYRNGVNVPLPTGTDSTHAGLTFTPTDNGSYVVRLSVTDEDGGITTVNSSPIVVADAAPAAVITGDLTTSEGVPVELGSTVTDPGDADETAGFTYAWQAKQGDTTIAEGEDADFTFTPLLRGTYTVSLAATDKDGVTTTTTSTVNVANAPPTAELVTQGDPVLIGTQASFYANYGDVPADQAMTVRWDFGDGSATTSNVYGSGGTAYRKHAYAAAGTYTVTATVDDGADQTTSTGTVTVSNAAIIDDPASPGKRGLIVVGTAANDTITVTQAGNGRYGVTLNGDSQGTGFNVNGRIYVYGNGGSNTITVTGTAGATVFAGGANSTVTTGAGNDVLIGSSGVDRLNGGDGRDVLVGMNGADVLHGGDGDDLLIAGGMKSTDVASLKTVADKWFNPVGDTATRRKAIVGLFSKQLVADAGSNQLYGEAKNDWLVFNTSADKVKDLQKTDFVN